MTQRGQFYSQGLLVDSINIHYIFLHLNLKRKMFKKSNMTELSELLKRSPNDPSFKAYIYNRCLDRWTRARRPARPRPAFHGNGWCPAGALGRMGARSSCRSPVDCGKDRRYSSTGLPLPCLHTTQQKRERLRNRVNLRFALHMCIHVVAHLYQLLSVEYYWSSV